eukprot:1173024-Prorocentrum_minimum.AAC.1
MLLRRILNARVLAFRPRGFVPAILEVLPADLLAEDPLCDYELPIQYLRTAVEKTDTSLVEKNTGHFQ